VVSYCESGTCSTARSCACTPAQSHEPSASLSNEALPMPDVEEGEEAAPEAPCGPTVHDDSDNNLYA
jgi:hypothetical protein